MRIKNTNKKLSVACICKVLALGSKKYIWKYMYNYILKLK